MHKKAVTIAFLVVDFMSEITYGLGLQQMSTNLKNTMLNTYAVLNIYWQTLRIP